jgi:hypothetical protein
MKAGSENATNANVELPGEAYQVINVLAAILALTSVKSSPPERALMSQELARAFEILAKRLKTSYDKAKPEKQEKQVRFAAALAKDLQQFAKDKGACCVGFGCKNAATRAECEKCDPNGDWACNRPDRLTE